MLENINSIFIFKKILECIEKRKKLNLFRYSKLYQTKFNIKQIDYIFEFFDATIDLDTKNNIYNQKESNPNFLEYLFEDLKQKFPFNISNDILKECIINYVAKLDDKILSINHTYFSEIIAKRLLLKKNDLNIEFDLEEYLSQNDLLNIITHQKSGCGVSNYIKEKLNLNNSLIKKLELILNSNINLNSIYFKIKDKSILTIDYEKDKIEFDEKESDKEKNMLIDFKHKRADLINKILEKYCKNIKKLKYMVFEEITTKNIKKIFPLVELDKFENLNSLDLDILFDGEREDEIIYNFTNKLSKLKELRINKYHLSKKLNDIISLYIQKETLNNLKSLEIIDMNWIVEQNESFDFIGLERIYLDNVFFPQRETDGKKYFFKEMLKGNLKWEKLKTMEIYITFDIIPNEFNEFTNNEIINFLKVARERDYQEAKSEFYPNFFNFIFSNQNIYIKTNELNKNIENFKLRIYDCNRCSTCRREDIIYEKKGKNVNISLGRIYGKNICVGCLEESALLYINLDNFMLDPSLDSFTFDHLTIDELNKVKQFISNELKKINKYETLCKEIGKKANVDLEKEKNELKIKIESSRNKRNYEDIDEENYYEKIICKIESYSINSQLNAVDRLIQNIKTEKLKRSKKYEISNVKSNYDIDINFPDLFGD